MHPVQEEPEEEALEEDLRYQLLAERTVEQHRLVVDEAQGLEHHLEVLRRLLQTDEANKTKEQKTQFCFAIAVHGGVRKAAHKP